MSGNPLDVFKEFDPKILDTWKNLQELTFAPGALTPKTKLIIALAIDVELGSVEGATALGRRALKAGATKEEIVEAMRVAYSIAGNSALFTSAAVFAGAFQAKLRA